MTIRRSARRTKSPVPSPGDAFPGIRLHAALAVLAAGGLLVQGFSAFLGWGLFACALFTALSALMIQKGRPLGPIPHTALRLPLTFILFFFGATLVAGSFSAHPANWDLWAGMHVEVKAGGTLLVLGLFSMAISILLSPKGEGNVPHPSPRLTTLLMLLLLSAAFWIRLAGFWDQGHYWDEMAESIAMSRALLDLGDFRIAFPQALQSAFYHYFTVLLWSFHPDAGAYVMQRLTPCVLDLLTIWLLYLAGKEAGGRRAGLFTAAAGVLFKPLIWECVRGVQVTTMPFFGALTLLFLLRYVRKPDIRHAIQFGLALGSGIYAYSAHRLMIPLYMLGALPFLAGRLKGASSRALLAASSFSFIWVLVFLLISRILPCDKTLFTWAASPWAALAVGILYAVYAGSARREGKREGRTAAGWILSLTLAWIAMSPILYNPGFGERFQEILRSSQQSGRSLTELVRYLAANGVRTWNAFFLGGGEDSRSLLDPAMGALLLFGTLFSLSRPQWLSILLLMLAAAGLFPHVLPPETHNARASASYAPLIFITGLSLDGFFRMFPVKRDARVWRAAFLLILLIAGIGIALYNHRKIHAQWAGSTSIHMLVRNYAAIDAPTHRVYITSHGGFIGGPTLSVLGEGIPIHVLPEQGTLYLRPGETLPDLVIFISPADQKLLAEIKADYPDAVFTPLAMPGHDPEKETALIRALIPARDVERSRGRRFTVVREDKPWLRQVYSGLIGLGHGWLLRDDLASNLTDPFVPGLDETSVRASRDWMVEKGGSYRIRGETRGALQVFLDGKKVMSVRPFRRGLKKFSAGFKAAPGKHVVEVVSHISSQQSTIPALNVKGPDGVTRPLGE